MDCDRRMKFRVNGVFMTITYFAKPIGTIGGLPGASDVSTI